MNFLLRKPIPQMKLILFGLALFPSISSGSSFDAECEAELHKRYSRPHILELEHEKNKREQLIKKYEAERSMWTAQMTSTLETISNLKRSHAKDQQALKESVTFWRSLYEQAMNRVTQLEQGAPCETERGENLEEGSFFADTMSFISKNPSPTDSRSHTPVFNETAKGE